jgi:hypothetical protein
MAVPAFVTSKFNFEKEISNFHTKIAWLGKAKHSPNSTITPSTGKQNDMSSMQ